MGSGCLTCCRWCCCCFISVVNVLTTILGLGFLALGCITLWAYSVVRSAFDAHINKMVVTSEKIQTSMDVESLHKAMESSTMVSAIVLIVLGVVLITFGCLGCCGACFGVPACLIIYAVFVGLVLLTQAALVIMWFTNSDYVNNCSRNWLETRITNYRGVQNMDVASLELDFVQMALGCCGFKNGDDFYAMSKNWNRTIGYRKFKNETFTYYNASYPYSCCKWDAQGQDYTCAYANVSQRYSNSQTGCYQKLVLLYETSFRSNVDNAFYGVAGTLGLEILLLLGALIIYYHKRQDQEDIPHSGVQYKMQPQMA